MTHTPHELSAEFPEFAERIHTLKTSDAHFARLLDQYHEVNRAVHRAETLVDPVDTLIEAGLRKERLALKDEIYQMLKAEVA